MDRLQEYRFHQGKKQLTFSSNEYNSRLAGLRAMMRNKNIDACVFTSMHNIAYFSGFLYCSFGHPYGLAGTKQDSITISAGIEAAQLWRQWYGDNITYTDWQQNNYWRSIKSVTGTQGTIWFKGDHLSLAKKALFDEFLLPMQSIDITSDIMRHRMYKSAAELTLICHGAAAAAAGGYAIREAISEETGEIDIAMELETSKRFPDAQYRDT